MGQKKNRNRFIVKGNACIFCGKDEDNEIVYGKFFHKNNISVHQNCMFFSSGLVQRGSRESDGILRFRIPDIKEEASRGQKLRCFVCKKSGSTIGCIVNNCRKSYHFPCGIKKKVLFQHFGKFSSYCQAHKPQQKATSFHEDPYCHICCTPVSDKEFEDCLYSPCCKKNLFHYSCLQKYALSAGLHFFKCPLCNNSAEFVEEMRTFGICIPDKDAAWELEKDAYNELLFRPECSAEACECSVGRNHDGEGAWELFPCADCGADARHRSCANMEESLTTWKCEDCLLLEDKILSNKKSITSDKENVKVEKSNLDLPNNSLDESFQPLPMCSEPSSVIECCINDKTLSHKKSISSNKVEKSNLDLPDESFQLVPLCSETSSVFEPVCCIKEICNDENFGSKVDHGVNVKMFSENYDVNILQSKSITEPIIIRDLKNEASQSEAITKPAIMCQLKVDVVFQKETITESVIIHELKDGVKVFQSEPVILKDLRVCLKRENYLKTDGVKKMQKNFLSAESQKRKLSDISNKSSSHRRFKKKQRGCCSDSSNKCIRKMFGLECQS